MKNRDIRWKYEEIILASHVGEKPLSSRKIQKILADKYDIRVSHTIICRDLQHDLKTLMLQYLDKEILVLQHKIAGLKRHKKIILRKK